MDIFRRISVAMWKLVLLVTCGLVAGHTYPIAAWTQSPNAISITPNDFWFNNCLGDTLGNTTEDPYHLSQWYLLDDCLNLPRAWSITTGDSSVVIVSKDIDIQVPHPDMNLRALPALAERNGISGVDDDHDGHIDNAYLATGNRLDSDIYSYPPWVSTRPGFVAGNSSGRHGTFCLGQVVAGTNNGTHIAGIDWKCKYSPMDHTAITGYTAYSVVNWVRYLKYDLGQDVRVVSASYTYAFTAHTTHLLIEMGVLPITGAGNNNSSAVLQSYTSDSLVVVGAVNINSLRTIAGGSSYGSEIDCVGYSAESNNFYRWTDFSDITDHSASWRAHPYNPGKTGADKVAAFSALRADPRSPITLYSYWMQDDGTGASQFWDEASTVWRAIAFIGANNRPPYGTYNTLIDGVSFQTVLTSGATSQATGVATLIVAHNKSNETPITALGLRAALLRGCVNVDRFNSFASGGYNRCCSDGTVATCTTGVGGTYVPNDDCDLKLGAGRLDAYRSLTLWGRVAQDTTFQGDVYVSGDVLFTNDAVITIKAGTKFHIMPEDITNTDPWQSLIQYDPDRTIDDTCAMTDQMSGEEDKIEIVIGEATVQYQGTGYDPIYFQSYCTAPTNDDWCRLRVSNDAIVTGYDTDSVLVLNASYNIVTDPPPD